jgi:hypothetical protein
MHKKREAALYLVYAALCFLLGIPFALDGSAPIIGFVLGIFGLSLLGDAWRSYAEYRAFVISYHQEMGKQHARMDVALKAKAKAKAAAEPTQAELDRLHDLCDRPEPAKMTERNAHGTVYTLDELKTRFGDAEIRVAGTKIGTVEQLKNDQREYL